MRAHGRYSPWTSERPAHWAWESAEFSISLTEGVLLRPIDPSLACVLDVWSVPSYRKVLSVWWIPERPWEPPGLSKAKDDGWLEALGWSVPQTPLRDSRGRGSES